MNLYQEYASWVKEIEDFYLELKEHHLSLYERFMPIYEVLNYLFLNTQNKKLEPSDDIERIFTVGYEYLHDQIAQCKIYLDMSFHGDFHEFMHYDELISLLFYIEDLRYELSEKSVKYNEEAIEEMITDIEGIIESKGIIPENYTLFVDDKIKSILEDQSFDFYGIIDIFVDVAETLGIYLYEDTDFTIGKDI